MSLHRIPLTELEREGLIAHGLGRDIGKPSQLADVFRQGMAYALKRGIRCYAERSGQFIRVQPQSSSDTPNATLIFDKIKVQPPEDL